MNNYIYMGAFFISLPIVFNLLFKLKFQTLFKEGRVVEIRIAYILVSIILAHLLASFVEKFYLITSSF